MNWTTCTALALSIAFCSATMPVGASAVQDSAQVRASRDIVYATHATGPVHLDLYRPTRSMQRPAPVLVYFHGGAWARGQRPGSWTGFRPFVEAGFAVVTVQYRLSGTARAPAAVEDARCALGWIARNAAEHGLDASRIVVTGTSAGGHLALMAGLATPADGLDPEPCGPVPKAAAILDHYGPADLRAASRGSWNSPSLAAWLGTGPDAEALAARMSPVALVRRGQPPVFIVHGDADKVVPIQSSTYLKAALDKAGVPVRMFVVPGGGHGGFAPEAKAQIALESLRFLREHKVID